MNYSYDYGYTTTVDSTEALGILAGVGVVSWIISMAICVVMIIAMWKIFKKAGKNGWEAIVPVYNIIVMLEISNIPVWQIVFYFIPFANIYIMFKQYIELAKKFGKSSGFGVLTAFFPFICLPILGFGSASYEGTATTESNTSILDVNENGVPNASEAKDFTYGYEKEETVIIPQVDQTQEPVVSETPVVESNEIVSDETKSE